MAFSLSVTAASMNEHENIFIQNIKTPKHTIIKQQTNVQMIFKNPALMVRTTEYPTQIVRVGGELDNSTLTCDEVEKEIDSFFSNQIKHDLFYYNTLIMCGYDPKTNYAIRYSIQSYFDPLNDKGIEYLQSYLAEHNGKMLLGWPFYVEDAQGVVVSMSMNAGRKNGHNDSTMLVLRHDNANHYFANNYQLLKELVADIHQRYNSNNPELILPFLDRWFFSFAGMVYERILKNSTYTELQPERIFLMEKEPKIFSSALKYYFANHCSKYPNKHCL